jgi:hypothetical protein
LERTLRAWKRDDVLTGDTFAAERSALRSLADACDHADRALTDGEGSAYTASMCADRLRVALRDVAAEREGTTDAALGAFLAGLGTTSVSD